MSFFKNILRGMGFGDSGDSVYDDDELHDDLEESQPAEPTDTTVTGTEDTPVPERPEFDPEVASHIFDAVLETFNAALPDFLRQASDPARQRQLLMESLSEDCRKYLDTVITRATEFAEANMRRQHHDMQAEVRQLKIDTQRLEQQRSNVKEQQLSADRRSRALQDRVTDLQSQVAALQAEREQFQLENKSLVNKLKVSEVHATDVEALKQEIARLQQLATSGENAGLLATVDRLTAENKELTAAAAIQIEEHRNNMAIVNEMRRALAEEQGKNAGLQAELDEASKLADEISAMQLQMEQVTKVIEARDEKISRLSKSLKEQKRQNTRLRHEIDETKAALETLEQKTPRTPLTPHPVLDLEVEDEPNIFNTIHEELPDNHDLPTPGKRITDDILDELTQDEDDFDGTNWLVATPPPGVSMRTSEVRDPEFGYQESPRRRETHRDNDAQLSLF